MVAKKQYELWNRRVHYFLGLYFLFFIWLFALTGLLLNHHDWKFAELWQNRKTATLEQAIQMPSGGSPLEQAHDLMRQLGVTGEIQWLATKPNTTQIEFRVMRPGRQLDIKADPQKALATIQTTVINAWGIAGALHTFTGVRKNDAKNERDWILTKVWAYAMDAVAVGLVVMVVSGLIMWWGLAGKRAWGFVALGSGVLVCGWFIFALRWMNG